MLPTLDKPFQEGSSFVRISLRVGYASVVLIPVDWPIPNPRSKGPCALAGTISPHQRHMHCISVTVIAESRSRVECLYLVHNMQWQESSDVHSLREQGLQGLSVNKVQLPGSMVRRHSLSVRRRTGTHPPYSSPVTFSSSTNPQTKTRCKTGAYWHSTRSKAGHRTFTASFRNLHAAVSGQGPPEAVTCMQKLAWP